MAENKGNPYHDEEGKFTSGGNQAHGKLDSEKRNPFKKKGPSPVNEDELSSSWMDLFGLGQKIIDDRKNVQPQNKRKFSIGTLDDKYNEEIEADSQEEAERIAQEKFGSMGGDEVFADEIETTEDKLGKMGFENDDEVEYGDIDPDYERSYGPVDSKEKYESYQKWLKDNGSGKEIDDTNNAEDKLGKMGFEDEKEGIEITDPHMDSTGRYELSYKEAVEDYGQEKIDNWRKDSASNRKGWQEIENDQGEIRFAFGDEEDDNYIAFENGKEKILAHIDIDGDMEDREFSKVEDAQSWVESKRSNSEEK